ncbi:hypothetical protein IQ251_08280 [Saccharopolyspora sp. HNM0983]|uniref:Uncharacterized protein n=1 Tax=Saccharopolyspora montiporae TaxID=2781240 RepID=A0A929B916_9PSEU|nr:hypothetical protein [Saccharopolyspora sp. HNM0983]MBE9374445.1 hypothetical protein [Saccharopolyspora sp. HNM0983]
METTTTAPSYASPDRLRRTEDPAAIWAPLAKLTEAAAAEAGSGQVAITRGFDRNSRRRARALRDLLAERDVTAVELTPAPGSDQLVGDEVVAVVNLIGAGSWQPYRVAAQLRAPVLTPNPVEGTADQVERDVIAVSGEESGKRDVALSHVALRSEDPSTGRITVEHDGGELSIAGGWLTATAQDQQLVVQVGGIELAEQELRTSRLRVQAFDAQHRLVRDELPIADFEGTLVLATEASGLRVRPV